MNMKFLISLTLCLFYGPQLVFAKSNKVRQIDSNEVAEVVIFSSSQKYSDKEVFKRAADVSAILKSYPGFKSRQFSVNANQKNEWLDEVHWNSLSNAVSAAKVIVKTPEMKRFMAVMTEYKMYHFNLKFSDHK